VYTASSLLDIHERSHRTLKKLLEHCRQFSIDEINREMPGFGQKSLRLTFYHTIGAEKYWTGVLLGYIYDDDDDSLYPTIDSLQKYNEDAYAETEGYLRSASPDELNTPRKMITDPNKERILMPARVIMRIQTHIYHHNGQIMTICRLLGKPAGPGLDFPIV
jgi:uncharacterized damage-inducible protein DinB